MIKIQEHLDKPNADKHLDFLAESLWNELNPKTRNKSSYKSSALIEKCKKYSLKTGTNEYRKKYAKNDINIAKKHKDFFDFLTAMDGEKLKNIITSRPNQFPVIKNEILAILDETDLFTTSKQIHSQTNFGKLLSETILDYTKFRGSDFCKKLFTKLGFVTTTCPYCNDNMLKITEIKSNSIYETRSKAYLDLDHFYSKSQHPYLAVSFFNLIPSCHDCNAKDKSDKLFDINTHIHPYYEAFDDFYEFRVSLKAILGDSDDEIKLERKSKKNKLNINDLNLIARYANYISQVEELVKFFKNYYHYLNTENEKLFIDAIFNRGIPRQRKDILKFQRGKMSRDILKQLDIHNILNLI